MSCIKCGRKHHLHKDIITYHGNKKWVTYICSWCKGWETRKKRKKYTGEKNGNNKLD